MISHDQEKATSPRVERPFWLLGVAVMSLFLSCSGDSPTAKGDPPGTGGFDQVINTTAGPVTVRISDSLTITIPQGIAPAGTHLKVKRAESAGLNGDSLLAIHDIYDVTLSSGTRFSSPLVITMRFDAALAGNAAFPNHVGAAWYSDSLKRWIAYAGSMTDKGAQTITFETYHLTKLAWSTRQYLYGYTDWDSSAHFYVYWKDTDMPSPADYASPYASQYGPSDVPYAKDMLRYLERGFAVYQAEGLTVPSSGKIDVYIKDLGEGTDGLTSFLGYLSLNKRMRPDTIKATGAVRTGEEVLPQTCFHELLHFIQDYYYMQLFSEYTVKWWLEATAVNADRIVDPVRGIFEAVDYANGSLSDNLGKPWDDCNSDPNYYVAGGFLAYLSGYRAGAKIDVTALVKAGGDATDISYLRTIVDNQIKASLGSAGVGQEYADYVQWAYEGTGAIRLPKAIPLTSGNPAYVVPALMSVAGDTLSLDGEVPRLAVRCVKIRNLGDAANRVKVKVVGLHDDLTVRMYSLKDSTRTNPQALKTGDSLNLPLVKGNQWVDLVCTNRSKDYSRPFQFKAVLTLLPTLDSIRPSQGRVGDEVTLHGSGFGTSASGNKVTFDSIAAADIPSWTAAAIRVKVPAGARSGKVQVKVGTAASNTRNFYVLDTRIDSVYSWDPIPVASMTTLDISGNDFGFTQGRVFFGAESAQVVSGVWGDKIIKIKIPIDATVKNIVVQTLDGISSPAFNFPYLTIPEYIQSQNSHGIFLSGSATFTWTDCSGLKQSETRSLYLSAGTSGMTCATSNALSVDCREETQGYTYQWTSGIAFLGDKPSLYKVSGDHNITRTYRTVNPSGSRDQDLYTLTFAEVPYEAKEMFVFGAPDAGPYVISASFSETRWDASCSMNIEKTADKLITSGSNVIRISLYKNK